MISVCMATYNGEKFIEGQLDSILSQLDSKDELVISDDSSTDSTINIIKSFKDSRIKLYELQKFQSPIFNFENSLKHSVGDIIVLSDQDDLWESNKIKVIRDSFKEVSSNITLMMYNGWCIDKDEIVIEDNLFDIKNKTIGQIKNITQEKKHNEKPILKTSQHTKLQIKTFDDLINFCNSNKEIKLKHELETNVNLVSFENKKIKISFNDRLDKEFIKNLSSKLYEWTNERWIILLSKENGAPSKKEEEIIEEQLAE